LIFRFTTSSRNEAAREGVVKQTSKNYLCASRRIFNFYCFFSMPAGAGKLNGSAAASNFPSPSNAINVESTVLAPNLKGKKIKIELFQMKKKKKKSLKTIVFFFK